ncbi:heterokaryon incompatibility protein-domain-containing protein, partial [Dichomitus squalens]
ELIEEYFQRYTLRFEGRDPSVDKVQQLVSSRGAPKKTMRALNTVTGQFEWIDPAQVEYAILSHTWDLSGEQEYNSVRDLQLSAESTIFQNPALSFKVMQACAIARRDGFRYIWIDSCCIDKSSSSELSESINSMFDWYRRGAICYAFLADVPNRAHSDALSRFEGSRWFKRGWTLQELIAPRSLVFLSADWEVFGTKTTLIATVAKVTGVEEGVLRHQKALSSVPVVVRMSWAANRETTRVEDKAYSLFGIFGIHLNTLYGEGENAFLRLEKEILIAIPDQTMFAWGSDTAIPSSRLLQYPAYHRPTVTLYEGVGPRPRSLVALSPNNFAKSKDIHPISHQRWDAFGLSQIPIPNFTSSPYGIRAKLPLLPISTFFGSTPFDQSLSPNTSWYLLLLACTRSGQVLARVCFAQKSQNPLHPKLLQRGYIVLSHPEEQRVEEGLDMVTLNPTQLSLWRKDLLVETVYMPFFMNSSDAPIPPSVPRPSASSLGNVAIRIIEEKWCRVALSEAQGYSPELLAIKSRATKDQTSAASTTYSLLLPRRDLAIRVDFVFDYQKDSTGLPGYSLRVTASTFPPNAPESVDLISESNGQAVTRWYEESGIPDITLRTHTGGGVTLIQHLAEVPPMEEDLDAHWFKLRVEIIENVRVRMSVQEELEPEDLDWFAEFWDLVLREYMEAQYLTRIEWFTEFWDYISREFTDCEDFVH